MWKIGRKLNLCKGNRFWVHLNVILLALKLEYDFRVFAHFRLRNNTVSVCVYVRFFYITSDSIWQWRAKKKLYSLPWIQFFFLVHSILFNHIYILPVTESSWCCCNRKIFSLISSTLCNCMNNIIESRWKKWKWRHKQCEKEKLRRKKWVWREKNGKIQSKN